MLTSTEHIDNRCNLQRVQISLVKASFYRDDNLMVAAWPDPSSLCKECGLRDKTLCCCYASCIFEHTPTLNCSHVVLLFPIKRKTLQNPVVKVQRFKGSHGQPTNHRDSLQSCKDVRSRNYIWSQSSRQPDAHESLHFPDLLSCCTVSQATPCSASPRLGTGQVFVVSARNSVVFLLNTSSTAHAETETSRAGCQSTVRE